MEDQQATNKTGNIKRALVKQVLSGDSIVLLGPAQQNGPPKELAIYLSNVIAPRMAKRPTDGGSDSAQDEPYAWESREFLRKKIVGQTVFFVCDFVTNSGREHGKILLGASQETAENVAESAVAEGLLEVRPGKQPDEYIQRLLDLQEKAKASKKGRWSDEPPSKHVRNIQWTVNDPKALVDKYTGMKLDAVVEQVRDGSTIRVFLLPSFEYVTIALSGIRAPAVRAGPESKPEEFGEEAKFFVEMRILQRDIKLVIEGAVNQNIMGTVLHPTKGNIAEFLLKEGYAKCVDKSMSLVTNGAAALREAEKYAKQKRFRLWKTYVPPPSLPKNSYTAQVIEVGLGDSLTILKDNGEEQKIYLSSLRPPPRREATENKKYLPLFHTPFMFEAHEFLRKRLIGKRVTVTQDYIQPKSDQFPEKICCTVIFNTQNIAEGLIGKGLARAIRHRNDDENRSPHHDALIAAEAEAEKNKRGLWGADKENTGVIRIQELQNDPARSKQFLPFLQRGGRPEGIVEFVTSGSRMKVYIPKEAILITFLLSGIDCPRTGSKKQGVDDSLADDAHNFAKSKVFQHDVSLEIESLDKAGSFIGYMFVQTDKGTQNLSEMLVAAGLASVHFTAERSSYYNALTSAEKKAKESKLGIWKNYADQNNHEIEKQKQANDTSERKVNYTKVVVSEVLPGLNFAAQVFENGPHIERLMNTLQVELKGVSPLENVRRGQFVAAQFSGANNLWHRAKVEGVKGNTVEICYIDYGNRDTVSITKCAALPPTLQNIPAYSREYKLALVNSPNDDYAEDAVNAFSNYAFTKPCYFINTEYSVGNLDAVTLYFEKDGEKVDIGKTLVSEGYALVEKRREHRLQSLISDYTSAENDARRLRRNIWRYGDFTGVDF